jgi:Zn ribbon nucleic-acid-binding protein
MMMPIRKIKKKVVEKRVSSGQCPKCRSKESLEDDLSKRCIYCGHRWDFR